MNLWKLTLFRRRCESCSEYFYLKMLLRSIYKCWIKKAPSFKTNNIWSPQFFICCTNISCPTVIILVGSMDPYFGGLIAHYTCFAVTSWMSVSKGIYRRCSSSFIWASKAQSKSLLASAGTPALNKAGSEGQGQCQDGQKYTIS